MLTCEVLYSCSSRLKSITCNENEREVNSAQLMECNPEVGCMQEPSGFAGILVEKGKQQKSLGCWEPEEAGQGIEEAVHSLPFLLLLPTFP